MESFHCKGLLVITPDAERNILIIKVTHRKDHVPYWSIDIPKDVKALVEKNRDMKTAEVSINLLVIDLS